MIICSFFKGSLIFNDVKVRGFWMSKWNLNHEKGMIVSYDNWAFMNVTLLAKRLCRISITFYCITSSVSGQDEPNSAL